jgi:hypothetical protein
LIELEAVRLGWRAHLDEGAGEIIRVAQQLDHRAAFFDEIGEIADPLLSGRSPARESEADYDRQRTSGQQCRRNSDRRHPT